MSFVPYNPTIIILILIVLLELEIIIILLILKKIRKTELTDEEINQIIDEKVKL